MSQIEAMKLADSPAPVALDSNPWTEAALAAYSHKDRLAQAPGDGQDQAELKALGFPQIPTMTAETQAAGQLDVLLRDWNRGTPFSKEQTEQISKSIRNGVYGLQNSEDPCAVPKQLEKIQNSLNRYLKGVETPFRDSTLSTPLEVRIRLDSENQIHIAVRSNELKRGQLLEFPLVPGKGPKYPNY